MIIHTIIDVSSDVIFGSLTDMMNPIPNTLEIKLDLGMIQNPIRISLNLKGDFYDLGTKLGEFFGNLFYKILNKNWNS